MESLTTVPLLIIDDFGMRKLPLTAAEERAIWRRGCVWRHAGRSGGFASRPRRRW